MGKDEDVRFELEVDGLDATWGVRTVTLRETVGAPYSGIVEALADGDQPQTSTLLGKGFVLRLSRAAEMRVVRGIIRHALVAQPVAGALYAMHIVPAIWRLGLGFDTRIYRDTTIPELVQAVVAERLGGAVEVDVARLTQTYETHEFILQYQESAWNLLSRWMEHEGIFCFEADSDEGERLVLADSMSNLPFARSEDDGQVRHEGESVSSSEAETVFGLRHIEELGVTNVAVAEYDWTNPSLDNNEAQSGVFPNEPPPEVYDHTDVATLHRYGGQQYHHNTAARGAQVRHEVLDLSRQRWSMRGNVVTARPGHVLRVEGAPDADLDCAYMIVRVESGGEATEGVTGSWKNSLAVVPTSKAFRLPPNTPRPVVPGPETAVVEGARGARELVGAVDALEGEARGAVVGAGLLALLGGEAREDVGVDGAARVERASRGAGAGLVGA